MLAIVPPQPPDLRRGLCVTYGDPELWHSDRPASRDLAISVCRRCPVLAHCRAYALSLRPIDDLVGVLGGLTVSERAAARRERQRALRAAAG
jgi:Transcription factor WhiB